MNVDITTIKSKLEPIIENVMSTLDYSTFKKASQSLETQSLTRIVHSDPSQEIAKLLLESTIRSLISKIVVKDVKGLISTTIGDRPEKSCIEAKGWVLGNPIGNLYGLGHVFELVDEIDNSQEKVVKIVELRLPSTYSRGRLEESLDKFNNQVKIAKIAHSIGIGPKIYDHFVCHQDFGISYGFIVEERIHGTTLNDWVVSKSNDELKDMRKKVREMIKKMHNHFTHNNIWAWSPRDILLDSSGTLYVVGLSRAKEVGKEVGKEDEEEDKEDEMDSMKKRDYSVLEFLKPKKVFKETLKEKARENVVEFIVLETLRRALDPQTGFLTVT